MRRAWVAATAALLSACGTASGTAQCSPCPGSSYVLSGLPDMLDRASVTVCVDGEPCATARSGGPIATTSLQFVPLAEDVSWAEYDGRRVTVSVRSHDRRWQGTGAFVYTPDGGGTCSCASLVGQVSMEPLTPRG